MNDKLLELKKTIDIESRERDKNIAVIQTMLQHNEALIKSIEVGFSELKADVLQKMNDINVSNGDSITKLMKENTEHFDKLNSTLISSIDKLRAENKESLDKINGTVNEKLPAGRARQEDKRIVQNGQRAAYKHFKRSRRNAERRVECHRPEKSAV